MLQIVANCCTHPPANKTCCRQFTNGCILLQAIWNCFTSWWRLDVSTTIFSTSYDCFRHISTPSTTFDRFRHFAARIKLKSAVQGPKTLVVEHKGLSDEVVDFVLYFAGGRPLWASDDSEQWSADCLTDYPTRNRVPNSRRQAL